MDRTDSTPGGGETLSRCSIVSRLYRWMYRNLSTRLQGIPLTHENLHGEVGRGRRLARVESEPLREGTARREWQWGRRRKSEKTKREPWVLRERGGEREGGVRACWRRATRVDREGPRRGGRDIYTENI